MTASREAFCWMTAQAGRVEHAVTDDAQARGMDAGKGWFEPLCGQKFLAACMDVGPLGRCRRCELLIQLRADLNSYDKRLTEYRRSGWLSRLLCRYQLPADVGCEPTDTPAASTSAGAHRRQRRRVA